MGKPTPVTFEDFRAALEGAGILEHGQTVSRVVIDAQAGNFVRLYIERVADERLLDVALAAPGITVERRAGETELIRESFRAGSRFPDDPPAGNGDGAAVIRDVPDTWRVPVPVTPLPAEPEPRREPEAGEFVADYDATDLIR